MEKNPADRYATAQELADDLRRFLEDKPIWAKRPTLMQRAAKWCRRHKSATMAAAVVLILAVAGLAASTWLIWLEKEHTKVEQERTKDALADSQANAERAQENLDAAYKILDEIYVDTAEKRLPREKELTAEDRQFLERALSFYEQFGNQHSSDPRVRQKTAEAYLRVGAIQERLGQEAKAIAAYRQAVAVSTQLVAESPSHSYYRQILAHSYSSSGGSLGTLMSRQKNEQAYAEALRLQEQLVRKFPANLDYQHDLGWTYFRLGYSRICSFWFHGSSIVDAEEPVRQAVAIREKLVAESPRVFSYRQELGMSLGNLGNILTATGRHKEAEKVVQRNLELRHKLVDDFPAEPETRHYLADAYQDLSSLHSSAGKFQDEVQALRQELALRQKLTAEFPSVRIYQTSLARCYHSLGNALREKGAVDEAIAALKEAIRLKPDEARFHNSLGISFVTESGTTREPSPPSERPAASNRTRPCSP